MRQFEVYSNPSPRSAERIPLVVVLQSHLLAASRTTLVAPMLRQDGVSAFTEISLQLTFKDENYIVLVAELAAVETKTLQSPLGDIAAHEDAIRRALDRLFTGF